MFTKLQKTTISFVISVCAYGKSRLQLDKFSWNFKFEGVSKIC